MSILLTKIPQFVRDELNRRISIVSANTPSNDDQLWLEGKTPWVKMQSNAVFLEGDSIVNNGLQQKYVLQSGWGKGTFSDSYPSDVQDSFRPRPGIESMDVAIKGHLGMMREAKVKFKVFTLGQLEVMQSLYMTPGIGVLLEWGWTVPSSVQSSLNLFTTVENGPNDRWLKQTLQTRIENGKGLYDALFGLVSDFSFNMNDDGTWDCETTLIGPGAMTVDINLNVPGNALSQKLVDYMENKIASIGTSADHNPNVDVIVFKMDDKNATTITESPKAQEQERGSTLTAPQKAVLSTPNLYVTWAFVEDSLNEFFATQKNTFTSGKLLDSSTLINGSTTNTIVPVSRFFQGLQTNVKGEFTTWRSLSPTNVIIQGHPQTDIKAVALGNVFINGKSVRPFNPPTVDKATGDLRSVFLNYHTIVKENFLNSETVQEALHKILSVLNESSGGIWDLNLLYNDDYSSFRVVDFKSIYGADNASDVQNTAFIFEANVKNSIVKNVGVNFRIPNALKVTAMIAVNAPAGVPLDDASAADRDKIGIFRGITRGVADRFARKEPTRQGSAPYLISAPQTSLTPGTSNTPQQNNKVALDKLGSAASFTSQNTDDKASTEIQKQKTFLHDLNQKLYFQELSGDEKGALLNAIFNYLESVKGGQGFGNSGVIPGDVTVTINGVAGLKWGNAFQMRNLPQRYIQNVVFQVKDITNEISGDGWSTTIVGLMRAKYNADVAKQIEIDTTGIPQPAQQTDTESGSSITFNPTTGANVASSHVGY